MSKNGVVLRAEGLKKRFPSGDRVLEVLQGVDLELRAGESLSIRGESGCGKTTLLHLIAGLEPRDEGRLFWRDQAVETWSRSRLAGERARFIGMIFQAFYLIPEIDARANVLLAARMLGRPKADDRERVEGLLKRVGLEERGHHLPARLSGGERQRVAIARALLNRPAVILADEPTGNLDETTGDAILDLLLELCGEEGASLVLVTHNPLHARRTDRRAVLAHGGLHFD
ncbi:MAG: ABC transporter ATP-binding protein [Puniceicoccaceae bacterium]|nr:MAG: ABC transporter ATP-binding protein [Puniceicoccaceae bacterium]